MKSFILTVTLLGTLVLGTTAQAAEKSFKRY